MTASISPGAGIAQPSAFHLTKTIVLVALVYGIAAFLLYTWNHTFPLGYHPDEESKVRQVLAGEYNFHHPMLLLSGVRTALVLAGNPENPQVVVEWGRTISALYTAIAIGFLVLLAGGWLGPWVAIAAGAFLVTNHQLFELSHYFKEDPAVLLGISATFLAIFWFGEKPTAWRATLLGVATGLAGSGKYVGFLVLPFVLMAIVLERQRLSLRASLPFWAGGLVTIVVLANIPVFLNPAGFAGGFERELGFAVEGHKGITRSVPHGVYGAVFRTSTNPVIWVLVAAYYGTLFFRRRSVSRAEWLLAAFPVLFTLVLSFSPKSHHRYFLPVTALVLTLSAAALVLAPRAFATWRTKALAPWFSRLVLMVGLTLGVLWQLPVMRANVHAFAQDGRRLLADYLIQHGGSDAVVLQDRRVNLDLIPVPFRVIDSGFAADYAPFEELRGRGVTHVAVAEGDFGRFFRTNLRATDEAAATYSRRRAFYEALFSGADLVFESEPGIQIYLQPKMRVYRLRD